MLLEVGRGLGTKARQGDLRMDGTIPLLVVVFAKRFGPIRLERADGPWRVVRLERIEFGVTFGAAVLPSRRACRAIALTFWLVSVARPCLAGLGLSCWRLFSSAAEVDSRFAGC